MVQANSDLKAWVLLAALAFPALTCSFVLGVSVNLVEASTTYTGASKPLKFYLHYMDVPVHVAGLDSKYLMNTTKAFRFLTQEEAHANSFYKPTGLPKIAIDFYVYPNFAGPVTIDGSWQVFLWINGSAYKPTGFTLDFREITVGGTTLWDSGPINPTVTSSIGEYIDVPVSNYNLSAPLTHAFNADTTLLIEVEVNAGSSADTRIWYDSPMFPSKVILPAKDYARPVAVKTYSVDGSETALFHYNWSESQRKVIVRANVTDPFGGYDVHRVNMTITDPAGDPVVNNVEMKQVSDGQWRTSFALLFEANWSYPETATLGEYVVTVAVVDNSGYYQSIDTGSFDPFIEEYTCIFTIGIIVYYDPVFLVADDADEPLPNAQVYVTWPNGTRDALPRYATTNGLVNLMHVVEGNYGLTIIWKDTVVQQTTVHVDSNGPYTIRTRVYQLTVQVFGNNGIPIHGAYVIVYTQSGVGYGLDTTNATGKASFKLPSGTYSVEAYFTSDYWLTVVRTSVTEAVSVTGSTSKSIVLLDFPPTIWSTIGFLILAGFLIAVAAAVAFILYFTLRRTRPRRRA